MNCINSEIYDMTDPVTRAKHISTARLQLELTGAASIPDFVTASALASMIEEARAHFHEAHRRDMQLGFNPKDSLQSADPRLLARTSPYRMWTLGSDLLDEANALKSLYRSPELIAFIREIVGEKTLHCIADPLININVTYMADGDQQGWHFDDNEFVVSLLLQSPESGGNFEYVPDATRRPAAEIANVLDGQSELTRRLVPCAGTLLLFRGRHALHRVAPASGPRQRVIALLSYHTAPDFVYSDQVRMNGLGRTRSVLA